MVKKTKMAMQPEEIIYFLGCKKLQPLQQQLRCSPRVSFVKAQRLYSRCKKKQPTAAQISKRPSARFGCRAVLPEIHFAPPFLFLLLALLTSVYCGIEVAVGVDGRREEATEMGALYIGSNMLLAAKPWGQIVENMAETSGSQISLHKHQMNINISQKFFTQWVTASLSCWRCVIVLALSWPLTDSLMTRIRACAVLTQH